MIKKYPPIFFVDRTTVAQLVDRTTVETLLSLGRRFKSGSAVVS